MIDALIDDGDVVVITPTNTAQNGEMVVAWLKEEEEATLKKFYREGSRVRLQPANSTMDPIYADADNVKCAVASWKCCVSSRQRLLNPSRHSGLEPGPSVQNKPSDSRLDALRLTGFGLSPE